VYVSTPINILGQKLAYREQMNAKNVVL